MTCLIFHIQSKVPDESTLHTKIKRSEQTKKKKRKEKQ